MKGLTAEALEEVALRGGECLPHDRRFALAQGDAPFDPAAPTWLQKRHFGCLMANARLALLHSAFDPRTGAAAASARPEGPPLLGDTRTAAGRAAIAAFLAAFLGEEARGTPRFVEAPGHTFTDVATKGGLDHRPGQPACAGAGDRHGARPAALPRQCLCLGRPPWAEFDLVGQEIQLGGARLRVFKRIVRCPATEVNPETGRARRQAAARRCASISAMPTSASMPRCIEGGTLAVGDALEPLQGDLLH